MNFEYVTLGGLTSSNDNSILAYALDTSGDEIHTVHFKRMADGYVHDSDCLTNSSGDIEWANDNKTLYYTTLDSIHRACVFVYDYSSMITKISLSRCLGQMR